MKATEGEEVKNRLEAELREKIKKMEKELENAAVKAAGKRCCNDAIRGNFINVIIFTQFKYHYLHTCFPTGGPSLTEENLESMCPSAAAIAAIVKPGMKFFDVSPKRLNRASASFSHSLKLYLHTVDMHTAGLQCYLLHFDDQRS